MITVNAFAKVNLSLDIVGRRDDGYHLVRMVMQSLDIADILTFEKFETDPEQTRIKNIKEDGQESKKEDVQDEPRIVTLLRDNRNLKSENIDQTKISEKNDQTTKSENNDQTIISENTVQSILSENSDNKAAEESDQADFAESSDNTPSLGTLPLGEDNLITRVARLMMEKYVWPRDPKLGVKITLEKNIPIAAGMAGGSSDAAATFKGINQLFELGLHDRELMEMGVTLGADIPYCIMGGTALSEGIGEVLTRLPDLPKCAILVAKPNISISTGEAYGGYDGIVKNLSGNREFRRPDVDDQVDSIYAGNLAAVADGMGNVLEFVSSQNHPEIKKLEKLMMENGALNAMMSGSGPTVFGIFEEVETAEAAAASLRQQDFIEQLFVSRPVY